MAVVPFGVRVHIECLIGVSPCDCFLGCLKEVRTRCPFASLTWIKTPECQMGWQSAQVVQVWPGPLLVPF
jgi:hypothetical protein